MGAGGAVECEESADTHTHHDHVHLGQDKSENSPQLALESDSWGLWHCVAQHFQNAVQRSAKVPRRPILRRVVGCGQIYLSLGAHGNGVCVCMHSLHIPLHRQPPLKGAGVRSN